MPYLNPELFQRLFDNLLMVKAQFRQIIYRIPTDIPVLFVRAYGSAVD